MADSIHDQYPTATDEWPRVTAQFLAAWVSIFADYDINSTDAAFAAGIGYLSRMLEDSTVMSGDMISQIADTGWQTAGGLTENIRNIGEHVLPQWGRLAAAYAEARALFWAAHEASNRITADEQERAARAAGDLAISDQIAAGDHLEAIARAAADAALLAALNSGLAAEAAARAAGDDHTRQQVAAALLALSTQLTAQIDTVLKYAQSIPNTIDQRAAAGYDPTLRARGNVVQRILDTAVAHDPLVADLVSKLAVFVIDLAGVEDPVLRIAAQLILKQVIDRLGLDSALHAMLGDLIGGILGGGQPTTLTSIMGDIGNRLDALEETTAALAPLAPEADDLHEMGTLLFDASLLAYFVAAVADPVATADDTVTALEAVTGPLLAPVRALLGM